MVAFIFGKYNSHVTRVREHIFFQRLTQETDVGTIETELDQIVVSVCGLTALQCVFSAPQYVDN